MHRTNEVVAALAVGAVPVERRAPRGEEHRVAVVGETSRGGDRIVHRLRHAHGTQTVERRRHVGAGLADGHHGTDVVVIQGQLGEVLSLISASNNFYGLTAEQIQSQVLLYLEQYDNGMRVIHIFSGLWLFPFGYLVLKSGFLPKVFGILLMLGCFGYLIIFLGNTLVPNFSQLGISSYISLPASLGEIGICLWLLIMGAKDKH